jgi:protein-tyrosine phosphatase
VEHLLDIHCHFVPGVDDGASTAEDGVAMLRVLRRLGFERVIATPHMHTSLFDNDKQGLLAAFELMKPALAQPELPAVDLSCEHHFDDVVFQRLLGGEGLPYPGGRAVLVEFPYHAFPTRVRDRFFDLRLRNLRPVLAHPERYHPAQRDLGVLEPLIDGGTALLLDVGALAGKYGRPARRTAERLLDEGWYAAACSDAHRPSDMDAVQQGIERLVEIVGAEQALYLLSDGPRAILDGTLQT